MAQSGELRKTAEIPCPHCGAAAKLMIYTGDGDTAAVTFFCADCKTAKTPYEGPLPSSIREDLAEMQRRGAVVIWRKNN